MADELAPLRALLGSDIREAHAVEILQVELRSTVERRSLDVRFRPAAEEGFSIGRLPPVPVSLPFDLDPWARVVDGAPPGPSWKTFRVLRDRAVALKCPVCTGAGRRTCGTCRGRGEIVAEGQRFWCGECERAGQMVCDACGATGQATAIPVLHVERTTIVAREVVADPMPPADLLAALAAASVGRIVHHDEADRRLEPRLGGGAAGGAYRGETLRHSKEVNDVVNRLLTEPPPEGCRFAGQSVTVLRFAGQRVVRSFRRRDVWAFGDPPFVWPPDAI